MLRAPSKSRDGLAERLPVVFMTNREIAQLNKFDRRINVRHLDTKDNTAALHALAIVALLPGVAIAPPSHGSA